MTDRDVDISLPGVEIAPGLRVPAGLLRFSFTTSRGPGGQNVNKLATRAVLEVSLPELAAYVSPPVLDRLRGFAGSQVTTDDRLLITSGEHRSQKANKDECLEKLRRLLIQARQRPKIRRKTKPSKGSIQRRLDSKKRHGEKKRLRRDV